MPRYDFSCECGEVIEREFAMSEVKGKVKCPSCGKMAKRVWGLPNQIVRTSMYERASWKNGYPRAGRGRGF